MKRVSPSRERWRQVQRLFAEVAGLEPERQAARLARAEPTLRQEVERLLERFARGEAIHERPPSTSRDRPPEGGASPPPPASPKPHRPDPPPVPRDVPEELVAGRYLIRRELGRGGMGVVYEAEDLRLGRGVALKFLPPHLHAHRRSKERFLVEARAASALDHPNVCTVYEADETEDGRLFIAMALYTGAPLAERVDAGPLPVREAVDLGVQIARGLCAAHRKGIVHRDLKPANVFVTAEGAVKLLDFGIAKVADSVLTVPGSALGTAGYASPEQMRGEGDHRVDLWALGVVLYEMLAGERPFGGASEPALMYAILHNPPPGLRGVRPEVPAALAAVVERCLAKDPEDRYALAEEVIEDLEALQEPVRPLRRGRRHPWQLWAAVGAMAAVLLFGLLVVGGGFGGDPDVRRIVVVPLVDAGGDPELTAGLSTALADVVGRVVRYADEPLTVVPAGNAQEIGDVQQARHRLGVSEAVTGEVRGDGGRVRVTLALVDARRARPLRRQTVEVAADRIAALQSGLVDAASALLGVRLSPEAHRALTAGGTLDPRAYGFYLKGRTALARYDQLENVTTAQQLFRWAIEEDPNYALAYAGLCEAAQHRYGHEPDPRWIDAAEADCGRALALESRLAPVHASLGQLYTRTGATDQALQSFTLALALDSLDATVYSGMGRALAAAGRHREAEEAYLRAIALEPDAWGPHNHLAGLYVRTGRFEEAAASYEAVLRVSPDHLWGLNNLGAVRLYLGRLDEAEAAFRRANALQPTDFAYSNLGVIANRRGRLSEETEMYRRALSLDSTRYTTWGNLGGALDRAGDERRAHTHYREALRRVEALLAVNPGDPDQLGDLASYALAIGEPRRARRAVERAMESHPEDVLVMAQASRIYNQLGERMRAVEVLRRALAAGYPAADVELDDDLRVLREDL